MSSAYRNWLIDSGEAEAHFPGFLSREVIEPVSGAQDFYTLVVRFDSPESLGGWLESDEWSSLYERVNELVDGSDRFSTDPRLAAPFWYRPDPRSVQAPVLKIWLSTVVALYPSIFVISLILQFVTFPFAVTLLLSNLLAVACVSWIAGPVVRRVAKSWMAASPADLKASILGAVALVATLLAFLSIFLLVPVGG